ncbi:MAG: aldo/keto reductase [Acidobacteria bacterium]|nr:aldo/keto reductase [Acidobacteriota bacterium]
MRYRTFGRTGIPVSEIGYGAWGIGQKQWLGGNDADSLQALRRAIELGLNFIDTALAYGDGHSEKLVGQVVRESSCGLYVATKVPPKNKIWPARLGTPIEEVFPYDYIVASTEESLRNLGVECIDLQQFHVWAPNWLANDDWQRAIDDLKRAGKIRYAGISINDHQPASAISAIETGLIDAVQVIYNVFDQSPEQALFPKCLELNIGVIARVPLDEGALTGKITESTSFPAGDFREFYFSGNRKSQVVQHVSALQRDLAHEPGTLAELALRFVLTHPAVSTVIPGMRSIRNVESNCAVSHAGPLSPQTLTVMKKHAWTKNFYQ